MTGIIVLVGFIIAGILTGLNVVVPYSYSPYIAVAILACLDSVFGAFTANIEKKFRMNVFLSGFFGNALIAMLLVFIGTKLNVDIYLAAVIVFTTRLFNNFTVIRRDFLSKLEADRRKKRREEEIKKDTEEVKQNVEKITNKQEENTEKILVAEEKEEEKN